MVLSKVSQRQGGPEAVINSTVGKRGPDPLLERAEAHLDPHEAGCSVDGQRVPGEGVEALAIEALSGFQAHSRHAALPLAPCQRHQELFRASLGNLSLLDDEVLLGAYFGSLWPPL